MSEFNITVPGGESKRLLTGGKYCPADIVVTAEGGGYTPVEEKDVNFYDYDGTLLYSYTLEEAQALTELPTLPSHDGLTCEGWNWSLEGVQNAGYDIDIGPMFITDNGETRLYIDLPIVGDTVDIHWSQSMDNGVSVDWGDGNAVETFSGAGDIDATHSYAAGQYTIRLLPASGCTLTLGGSNTRLVIGGSNTGKIYPLIKVELGSSVVLGSYAFYCAVNLGSVSFPAYLISYGAYAFCESGIRFAVLKAGATSLCQWAWRLERVSLAEGVSFGNAGAFASTYSLRRVRVVNPGTNFCNGARRLEKVHILSTSTTIGMNAFINCYCLTNVDIPELVTTISAAAFRGCCGLKEVHLRSTTPPTLANANVFTGVPSDCVFYVPANSLTAYQEATNYASIAAQMVGV